MNRKFSRFALSCTSLFSLFSFQEAFSLVTYETYLESWDGNYPTGWYEALNSVPTPPGATQYQNMTVDIAFASYVFTSPPTSGINGVQFTNVNNVGDVIHSAQAGGGKAKISFGGANSAYDISANALLFSNPSQLAANVAGVVNANYTPTSAPVVQFNGVDLDIEDALPGGQTNDTMAAAITSFLTALKPLLPGKSIGLTLKGQGWNTYQEIVAKNAASQNLVNYINFMEYDIWINSPSQTYATQIIADLQTYTGAVGTSPGPNNAPGWGIPASMIQVGLMPQNDDVGNNLTLAEAQSITQLIITPGAIVAGQTFYGVMTWDLDRDAQTTSTNPTTSPNTPWAYTNAIRVVTASTETTTSQNRRNQDARHGTVSDPFVRVTVQPNPGAGL